MSVNVASAGRRPPGQRIPVQNLADLNRLWQCLQDHLLAATSPSPSCRQQPAAVVAWRGVDRRAREALKRSAHWALLPEIEVRPLLTIRPLSGVELALHTVRTQGFEV